ncbi:neuronal acetylcholine receptor subunit alpha-3-like [Ostrea edulis]|uniref:neuronal acetylcholine receptor subunit alpha-3-like n=1 Tax=Ostrea edulis TaxID=37623 RepID=UPI0024AEB2DA|nr:neuronal acetylcholine receptor subunit alpha-3-like [Ostrea edulis]
MKTVLVLCWFLLLFYELSISVRAALYSDAVSLMEDVFKNYSTDIRPNQNLSEATEVSLDPYVFSVNDFDEVSGVISIVCGLRLIWHDFRLTWTPSDYGGLVDLPVPKKKLWVPNIFLIDPANKMEAIGDDDFIGRIYYNGEVNWIPAGLIQTLCSVNMYKFPFDTQECSFSLVPWGYIPLETKLVPYNNMSYADITYYSSNAEWDLEKTVMKRFRIGGYDNLVKVQVNLKRKSLYFVINMLAPMLLLSLLNPLVFSLPVDSGERVSYAMTIFLSFAVFMTLLSENIPRSSEPMSLLSYFLIVTMLKSTLICVLTVVNLNLHFKDPTSEVSRKALFILNVMRLQCLYKLCKKGGKKSNVSDNSVTEIVFVRSKTSDEGRTQNKEAEGSVTWKAIAEGYDKVLLYYFYLIFFLLWIILGAVLTS